MTAQYNKKALNFYGHAYGSRDLQVFCKHLDRENMWLSHFAGVVEYQLPPLSAIGQCCKLGKVNEQNNHTKVGYER